MRALGSLNALRSWLQDNALTVVLLIIGMGIIFKARHGNHKEVAGQGIIVLAGLLVIGIALDPAAPANIGKFMVHLVFS